MALGCARSRRATSPSFRRCPTISSAGYTPRARRWSPPPTRTSVSRPSKRRPSGSRQPSCAGAGSSTLWWREGRGSSSTVRMRPRSSTSSVGFSRARGTRASFARTQTDSRSRGSSHASARSRTTRSRSHTNGRAVSSMRILLAAHQTQGGIGTVAQGLARALPGALPDGDRIDVARGWADRRLRESKLGRLTFEQCSLPLDARRYDLVHLCDFRPLVLSRSRFLLTIHDVFFLQNPEWFPGRVARYKTFMLDLAVAKRPAQIVCVSEWTREQLLEHRPAIDADVVVAAPSGIAESNATYRPALERPYFLTVSTIEPRKNHLGLLRALRRARRDGFEAVWRVVGLPGYASDDILAALRREPGVELCGRVSDADLDGLFAGALFVATPSFAEGF